MIDRHTSSSALAIVVVVFVLAAAIVAAGRQPEHVSIQSRPLPPVLIVPTSAPTPTPDTQVQETIARLERRVAELETERNAVEPQAVYQEMAAPSATPYTADPQMSYTEAGSTVEISVPTDAPRLCDGFGDWRDYDAVYASSPACHKATP